MKTILIKLTNANACAAGLAGLALFGSAMAFGAKSSELREKADSIRASADELFKLQRIPWIMDPAEGFRLAKEEKRPVFLLMQTGDPLGDC